MSRKLAKGIGEAVAARTILRPGETWDDVAARVAHGNALLAPEQARGGEERELRELIADGKLLMSGRHLQHGDASQPSRPIEVFSNCATSSTSFMLFYLLMNGSGVGRAYDDDICLVDWDYMPDLVLHLDPSHEDAALWPFDQSQRDCYDFIVSDSREGWAQLVELLEVLSFLKTHKEETLAIDFSIVRPRGRPIMGMQGRPASGPIPLAQAIKNVSGIKGLGFQPWKQAMLVDHYLAECVLVGGARRSSRMSTKWWGDEDIIEFINMKRRGQLWSANNSVCVGADFWQQKTRRSKKVLNAIVEAAYYDGTGEPGIINQHNLHQNDRGYSGYLKGDYVDGGRYAILPRTNELLSAIARAGAEKEYKQITNPCGEISLLFTGGYCVIADVVPYHCDDLADIERALRAAVRALIRVNLMPATYSKETARTNRIGVSLTGIHEWAWRAFELTFQDLIDPARSAPFWRTVRRLRRVVRDEARRYSEELGVNIPHTDTTIKPSGSVSKLFGLTEGAHLPPMREYLRWVQFRYDDPLVAQYQGLGYPIKPLSTYNEATAVGFPTQPEICRVMPHDKIVTAAEATPEEQYRWLLLLERNWLSGAANQVSYTLKYKQSEISLREFKDLLIKWHSQVKCASVMPFTDSTAYEYQPEEPIDRQRFAEIVAACKDEGLREEIDLERLRCDGACPI